MTDLRARYGRTRKWSRRERLIGIGAGIAMLLTATLWVWWVGTDPARTSLQSRDIAYDIVDDTTIRVVFEVSVEAGTPVTCAVEALSSSFSIVGWREVELPAADAFTATHVVELRTSQRPTTGLVSECWLS